MKKKATEDQFNELHNLVTKEFLARIKSGEASTQDLKAACDWLKTNDISGVQYDGNPLDKLAKLCRLLTQNWYKRGYMASRTSEYYKKNLQLVKRRLKQQSKYQLNKDIESKKESN